MSGNWAHCEYRRVSLTTSNMPDILFSTSVHRESGRREGPWGGHDLSRVVNTPPYSLIGFRAFSRSHNCQSSFLWFTKNVPGAFGLFVVIITLSLLTTVCFSFFFVCVFVLFCFSLFGMYKQKIIQRS